MSKKTIVIIFLIILSVFLLLKFKKEASQNSINKLESLKTFCGYYTGVAGGVYFHGDKLVEADYETFECVNKDYSKDKNKVYYNGKSIDGSDPETFKIIDYKYAEDKNFVYDYGKKISRDEFEFLTQKKLVPGARNIKGDYYQYNNEIYYWDDGGGQAVPVMIKLDLNPNTFEIINEEYSKDDKKVFHLWFGVRGADPETFQLLKYNYGKDKSSVFYDGYKLAGSDSKTFIILNYKYGKDNNLVFYEDKEIIGADPKTFQIIDLKKQISKANNNIHWREEVKK